MQINTKRPNMMNYRKTSSSQCTKAHKREFLCKLKAKSALEHYSKEHERRDLPIIKKKTTPVFWRSSRGEIGVIFSKEDSRKAMQKKERLKEIIRKQIEKEENILNRSYMLNHPMVRLLEKNTRKVPANEIFVNEFDGLKEFNGLAMNSSIYTRPTVLDEILFLGLKQKMKKPQRSKHKLNFTLCL